MYVSKKHINKIFEYLDNDDDESIQKLIDNDKASKYASKDFIDDFINIGFDHFQFEFTCFNFWKVQNVIDNPQ